MTNWLSAAVVLIVGASFLAWGTTVVWGVFLGRTTFVQRTRRQYAELPRRTRSIGRARVLSLSPLAGGAFIAAGIAMIAPPAWRGLAEALRLGLIGTAVLAVLALVAPAPFVPTWMREIDSAPEEPARVTLPDAD